MMFSRTSSSLPAFSLLFIWIQFRAVWMQPRFAISHSLGAAVVAKLIGLWPVPVVEHAVRLGAEEVPIQGVEGCVLRPRKMQDWYFDSGCKIRGILSSLTRTLSHAWAKRRRAPYKGLQLAYRTLLELD
jgi:hypothetical protein